MSDDVRRTAVKWAGLLGLVLLAGCQQAPTAIVVVVDGELAVPDPLASVRVELGGAACASTLCTHDFPLEGDRAVPFPFSFTVLPASSSGGPLDLVVRGQGAGGADRVVRRVTTAFVPQHTRLLRVVLEPSCLGVACVDGETCVAGTCGSAAVDPATLTDVVPGAELDSGILHPDGGARDGGPDTGTDGGGPGADVGDVGSVPRSCGDLASGAAPGAYTIDPDGPGGAAPFLDWCETVADGGGWSLIARADPTSAGLAYSATAWTSVSASGAFGSADTSVSDALLPSYWLLPVHELRIVVADVATPTLTRSLLTQLDTTTTLRAAMEPTVTVHLDAPAASWTTLVGASAALPAATCEVAGVPALLPAGASAVRVRIGYVWADTADCSTPGFWAGIGAEGMGCRAVASASGGGRICGTGVQREDLPLAVWVFGR